MPSGNNPILETKLTSVSDRCNFTLPIERKGSVIELWLCIWFGIPPRWNRQITIFVVQWNDTESRRDLVWSLWWDFIIRYNAESSPIRFYWTTCNVTSVQMQIFAFRRWRNHLWYPWHLVVEGMSLATINRQIYFSSIFHSRLIPMYNARFVLWPPSLSSPFRKRDRDRKGGGRRSVTSVCAIYDKIEWIWHHISVSCWFRIWHCNQVGTNWAVIFMMYP